MLIKQSQETKIINQLLRCNKVSRNWCLKNYVSRLSAIIFKLKEDGWEFSSGYDKSPTYNDFIYVVTKRPRKLKNYRIKK